MVDWKSQVPSQYRHVGRIDSGSGNFKSPPEMKTIYSGISATFTTKITRSPQIQTWKPVSMKAVVLIPFIFVTLFLGVVIEILSQKSSRHGGLCLTPKDDGTSTLIILSRYGPTVIAVIYSLTWTWIDLDIRRIQPWLELSKSGGGTAESTLLLDYPFEFLALIPIKAWKKKHWLVLLAGTIMMLIFWAITPLQSAIFGTREVSIVQQVVASDVARLASLEHQMDALDTSILNIAYGITWLNQPYPAFTTHEMVLIPFQPLKADAALLPDESWTTNAVALSTDLQCWAAIVTMTELADTYTFDNGQGCKATLQPSTGGRLGNESGVIHTVLYIGYHENAMLDWFLQNPDCSQNASHQFLAIWMAQDTREMTALFCEPSYRKQEVIVTVTAGDTHPDESTMTLLGDPASLSEAEFNTTAFEYLIGTGVPPKLVRRDYPRDRNLEQFSSLSDFNLAFPITNMVGFALGGMNYSITELKDPAALQDVFSSAHRKLFSAAVPSLLQRVDQASPVRPSTIRYTLYGIVVNRPLALAVESLLLVVALLVAAILYLSHRTKSILTEDPGCMASTLSILGESDGLLKDFAPRDRYDDAALGECVKGRKYALVQKATTEGVRLRVEHASSSEPSTALGSDLYQVPCNPLQPKALKPLTGLAFVVVLLTGIVVLVYLKKQEGNLGGLPRPTDNFTILQLLENYVPTIFATLVEPFLVLLNRLLCLLQPFHDLRRGRQPAVKAFETTYTSLPPQLSFWQSLKAGHVLLASLCLVSLSANILAVALGGLFNEYAVAVAYNQTFLQAHSTEITPSDFLADVGFVLSYDHFYVTAANMSLGTQLTPWTDAEFAYMPFALPLAADNNDTTIYRSKTKGFGVEVTCSALSTSDNSFPYVDYSLNDDGSQNIYVLFETTNGPVANCTTIRGMYNSGWLDTSKEPAEGTLAQELVSSLYSQPFYIKNIEHRQDDGGICDRKLALSWMRINPADRNGSQTGSHMFCAPVWQSATFDLFVDSEGHVLEASRVGDFDDIDDHTRAQTETVLTAVNDIFGKGVAVRPMSTMGMPADDDGWHNDTLSRDWINHLLTVKLNSTRLLDPMQPVPDLNMVSGPLEDLYKTLAANMIGMHIPSLFRPLTIPAQVSGTKIVGERRIFMDDTAFIVTITILGLMVIVATALYVRERRPFLPRLPSTIGSLLAYVAASQAVKLHSEREREKQRGKTQGNRGALYPSATYSFGTYLGMDGQEHVGIEVDPFVTLADNGSRPRFRMWFDRYKGQGGNQF